VNGHAALEPDVAVQPTREDHVDRIARSLERALEEPVGEFERAFDAHTAVAEGARRHLEIVLRRRVVQVDVVLVRAHEF